MSEKVFPPIRLPENVRPTKYLGYYCSDRGEVYREPGALDSPEKCNKMGLIELKGSLRGNPKAKRYMYLGYNISLRDSQGKFIRQKKVNGHRLVAETWIPNPEGYDTVDHIDRDKSNNHVSNLRWCTRHENASFWERDEDYRREQSIGKRDKIHGIGINDMEGFTSDSLYYDRWMLLIKTALSNGQEIYEDWKYYSKFESWATRTLKEGDQTVFRGNKVGPDDAIVLPNGAYGNIAYMPPKDDGMPVGVSLGKRKKGDVYLSRGRHYIGTFKTKEEAHRAWQNYKITSLHNMLKDVPNEATSNFIISIINKIQNDIDNGEETKYLIND